jgi:hypothetical protein
VAGDTQAGPIALAQSHTAEDQRRAVSSQAEPVRPPSRPGRSCASSSCSSSPNAAEA